MNIRSSRRVRSVRNQRPGNLYPIVMVVSAMISLLAIAGLEMSRVAGRANQQLREQVEARRMAQAGLEYWQRQYNAQSLQDPSATLELKTSEIAGFRVSASMSSAGVNPSGAAQVTSVGTYGNAVQKLTARYEARPTLYDGFRCSLYSDAASVTFDTSTVSANHWSIARQDTSATNSSVALDVMTGNSIIGTLTNFKQRQISGIPWNMRVPSFIANQTTYPGSYYMNSTARAVTIQPFIGNEQLLANPEFASGMSPWYCNNASATLSQETGSGYNSTTFGRLTNRSASTDSPVQEISRFIVPGASYIAQCFVNPNGAGSYWIRISIYLQSPSQIVAIDSPKVKVNPGSWTKLNMPPFTFPKQTNQPARIELSIVSDGTNSFSFDAFQLCRNDQVTSNTYIDTTVLSDTYNPFSVNNSSPATSGIYIVDCRDIPLIIRNCRIRSTLVFTRCPSLELAGGIVWETTGKNYPAIITDGKISDKTTFDAKGGNSLREVDTSFNFNPSHTPFAGLSNITLSDDYPCSIKGAIFAADTMVLGNTSKNTGTIRDLTGPILAKNSVSFLNTTKEVRFSSDMILNPPPGFYPTFTPMRLIPSSIDE